MATTPDGAVLEAIDRSESYRLDAERSFEELAGMALLQAKMVADGDPRSTRRDLNMVSIAEAAVRLGVMTALAGLITKDRTPILLPLAKSPYDASIDIDPMEVDHLIDETRREVVRDVNRLAATTNLPEVRSGPASRKWAKSIGQNMATKTVNQVAVALAPSIAQQIGYGLRKMWISRGDSKVRDSHREQHAVTRGLQGKWDNGLEYPGDTSGPMSEWINCRCGIVLVPTSEADLAERLFTMEPSEFGGAMAAAGARLVDRSISETSLVAETAMGILWCA